MVQLRRQEERTRRIQDKIEEATLKMKKEEAVEVEEGRCVNTG